jgi:hypothetical protein
MFANKMEMTKKILEDQKGYEHPWEMPIEIDVWFNAKQSTPNDSRTVLAEIASEFPNDKQKAIPCLVCYNDRIWWIANPGLINFETKAVKIYRWMEVPK